jgi:AcrR family transcriptional regulator
MSLRERKKEQTRQAIAEAARRLFSERGFEDVTVAEVAREADVSVGTVFNYFPTKEDLFYSPMEAFEAELVAAVARRKPGQSVAAAFRRFVLERSAGLVAEDRAALIERAERIRSASPALQAREREISAQYTQSLAELIAEETGKPPDDVEAAVVANALMGAQRTLVDYVRASVLAGKRGPKLEADSNAQGRRAFKRLERGLADYAVKPVNGGTRRAAR